MAGLRWGSSSGAAAAAQHLVGSRASWWGMRVVERSTLRCGYSSSSRGRSRGQLLRNSAGAFQGLESPPARLAALTPARFLPHPLCLARCAAVA